MCGINGLLERSRALDREALEARARRMALAIAHRGPDDEGTWADPAFGIALGHRRLSIIDLSALGHQPMVSNCGRYVISYVGEIYNFPALRAELEGLGHAFRGHSDTEVMLGAFTQWGFAAGLERLNGMFGIAVWDRAEACLLLARDRLGEKTIYYGWAGDAFLFGSELKALLAHPALRGEVNRDALALYLRHGYVPAPHTMLRGIHKLPAATFLTLRADAAPGELPVPVPYWQARRAAEAGLATRLELPLPELEQRFEALLGDAVGMRMLADVPLGAFLSGGTDSSTIVALMQAQSTQPVRTFTIGFHEAAFDEAPYARAVAAHLGTEHTELYVTPAETLDVIPRLPAIYDEPFSDPSQVPTFLVSQLARRHVTVSLSGDGGDELFGGYDLYQHTFRRWRALKGLSPGLKRAAELGLAVMPKALWRKLESPEVRRWSGERIPRHLAHRVENLSRVLAQQGPVPFYRHARSHWPEPEALVRGGREAATAFAAGSLPAGMQDFREQMMLLDQLVYLPDDILVKVDRAAMAVALEPRVPLLDHRVVEFAWQVPLALKFHEGGGKWLLKRLLARHVPPNLVERPKMGFGVPIGEWLRGPLRDWAEALLAEERLAREGWLLPGPVREKWREHLSGEVNWQYLLWDVLMFQAWYEHYRGALAG